MSIPKRYPAGLVTTGKRGYNNLFSIKQAKFLQDQYEMNRKYFITLGAVSV